MINDKNNISGYLYHGSFMKSYDCYECHNLLVFKEI